MYYDKPVTVHAYAKRIEIFLRNGERIAVHPRRFTGRRYVTITEHMPPNHQAVVAFRSYDGTYYRSRAYAIGPVTGSFVRTPNSLTSFIFSSPPNMSRSREI